MNLKKILTDVGQEFIEATEKFGSFHNTHEGYAVLKEEVDELWDEIKGKQRIHKIRREATQVAAMAVRIIWDCCNNSVGEKK